MGGLRYLLRAGDTAENLTLAKRILRGRSFRKGQRVTALATAGAGTITVELLASSDIIVRDPTGGNRTDTFDTVAHVVASLLTADGDSVEVLYRNSNGSGEVVTLAFPSGYTVAYSPGSHLVIVDGAAARIKLTRLSSTSILAEVARVGTQPQNLRAGTLTTAGAGTVTTALLAAYDIITRDPTGADRTDTFDTVANIIALLTSDYDSIEVLYRNVNGSGEAVTLAFPSGYTLHFAPGASPYILDGGAVRIRLTRITSASIAVEVARAGSNPAPAVEATAGAAAFTLKQIATGLIERDPNGAARADTVPTTASLIATLLPYDGAVWECALKNTGSAAEDITVTTDGTTTVQGAVVDVADGRMGLMRFQRLTDDSVTCLVLGDAT